MKVIGLTGSFGTGKTFVASVFKRSGAKVIDADKVAHDMCRPGGKVHRKIVSIFGKDILDARGMIDRAKLGRIAFLKKGNIEILNDIVHPEVIKYIRQAIQKALSRDILVIDAPLLIEAGLVSIVDKLVVVAASTENQIERCMEKFGITKEEVLRRIKQQIPLRTKKVLADFVIDNDGTKAETIRQAKKVWREIAWK